VRNRHSGQPLICLVVLSLLAAARGALADPGGKPQPGKSAQPPAARVLVAYYSRSGNTEKMAGGVMEGVRRVPGVAAVLKKLDQVTKDDLRGADAIILGCPTYYANVPGQVKVIIDEWAWHWGVDFTDKLGGAFSTGGGQVGGKEHVITSLLLYMLSNRMVVAGPLYEDTRGNGGIWGEPGAAAMTGPLDLGVSQQELDAAIRLGERIARLAKKVKTP
jgi:NAD(P)H dehydrogenase (quinone)